MTRPAGPDSQRLRNVLHHAAELKGGPRSQLCGYDTKVLVVGLVDQRAGYEFANLYAVALQLGTRPPRVPRRIGDRSYGFRYQHR